MQKIILFIVVCYGCFFEVFSVEYGVMTDWEELYSKISDIYHPSEKDFARIQEYLTHGERPYLSWLIDKGEELRYDLRVRNIRLSGGKGVSTDLHSVYYNNDPENRDLCVISYASYNAKYEVYLSRINKCLKKIGFSGHFLYRIGGWPDIEGGSLRFIHVPYSFKLCMIREAVRMGYKKIIWVDAAVMPLKNFSKIVNYLETDGYFLIDHMNRINNRLTPKVIEAFAITTNEMSTIHEIQASLMAFNMENPVTQTFLEECTEAMEELNGFLSSRPEQVAMGIIAHRKGMFPQIPYKKVIFDASEALYDVAHDSPYLYLLAR